MLKRRAYWLGVQAALAAFVVLAVVGFAVYGLATDGGDHLDATHKANNTEVLALCPSSSREHNRIRRLHADLRGRLPACERRRDRSDPCSGLPGPGVVQLRSCTDVIEFGGVRGCTGDHEEGAGDRFDVYAVDPTLGAGVIWMRPGLGEDEVKHLLLHFYGFGLRTPEREDGHSTRATSIMAKRPGASWDGLACE